MKLPLIDIIIFVSYCVIVVGIALWVSRSKKGHKKDSKDYFLAGNSLPWWIIGSSLIASNISAEQFIGMSGSGYVLGLAIASYEWMSAAALLIIAKYFLPIFLEKKIYTMPQFLEMRFDNRVRTSLAVFWLLVYVFINLTTVLYLGALALNTVADVNIMYAIIGLAAFAAVYSIYGGLMAVAWTDIIQVVVLLAGGLITTYVAVDQVSGGEGFIAGFKIMLEVAPEKFHMILEKGKMMIPDGEGGLKDAYMDLPGVSVIIGGMLVANLFYWGVNQYIVQRALAAKSLQEAQKGMVFAGYLKIIMPLIVVIPGIAAFVLQADITKSDMAFPWLLQNVVPVGVTGLAFAALIAAIVSSLSSMMNSTATIFTMDIYNQLINKNASEKRLVAVGRITSGVALIVAVLIAPTHTRLDQAFQFIQEFTGFVSPGILVIFIFGLFWKKATSNAALIVAILTIPLSYILKAGLPSMPFLDRMGVVFLLSSLAMVVISLIETKGGKHDPKAIQVDKSIFYTGPFFNIGAIGILIILAILYLKLW